MSQVELRTETAIAAPPAVVWRLLTDFAGYRRWNPMVFAADGPATAGSTATLHYRSNVGIPLHFRVRITRADPERELRWLGARLGISGDHYFQLRAEDGGTRLVHGEIFSGRLAGLLAPLFRAQIPVFRSFDRALRDTAERAATGDRAPAPP
jgi:hypothetical protein